MSNSEKEQKEKILQIVLAILQQDKELRETYQVGEKFRFIRDRLNALQLRIEENLQAMQQAMDKKTTQLTEDEILVYVYLYNAQGLTFQTWQKMVNPSVFYEYSVNRPIYADKNLIEAFVRSRSNKAQHGFLTVAVKKSDVLSLQPENMKSSKDQLGNTLIKIREGTLFFNKMISFTYQSNDYTVNELGQLVKKT